MKAKLEKGKKVVKQKNGLLLLFQVSMFKGQTLTFKSLLQIIKFESFTNLDPLNFMALKRRI